MNSMVFPRPGAALLALLLCGSAALPAAGADEMDVSAYDKPYTVQPGDVLDVSVWREEDLQRPVLVRPDGGISFPLVGELNAKGMSVAEIDDEITKRLAKYIPEPEVNVSVQQVVGNAVYVVGKVNQPGQIVAARPLDVMQVLGIAGGLNRFADSDNIKILRRQGGRQQAIRFDYDAIEQGENLEQNILLEPGDVVVVP